MPREDIKVNISLFKNFVYNEKFRKWNIIIPGGSKALKSFKDIYRVYVPERGFYRFGYYISKKDSF
jgi:hypothetical protein